MGQEIEVVFIGMEPFKSIKASETKAWDLRHQPKTGQIVWGVVKKVRADLRARRNPSLYVQTKAPSDILYIYFWYHKTYMSWQYLPRYRIV